jgi:hypothetical protein
LRSRQHQAGELCLLYSGVDEAREKLILQATMRRSL